MKWGSEFPDSFFMCQKVSNRETQWPFFSNTQKEKFPQTFMKKKRGVHKLRLKGVMLLNPFSSRKFIFMSYSFIHNPFLCRCNLTKFSLWNTCHTKENQWMKIEIIWHFCVSKGLKSCKILCSEKLLETADGYFIVITIT